MSVYKYKCISIRCLQISYFSKLLRHALEILRSYPDYDLNLEAFEALLLLATNEQISEHVKMDSIKTCLGCLEQGSAKVGVNLLLTVSG